MDRKSNRFFETMKKSFQDAEEYEFTERGTPAILVRNEVKSPPATSPGNTSRQTRQLCLHLSVRFQFMTRLTVDNHMSSSNHIKLAPQHLDTIKALADETHRPVEEVDKIYSETFEKLNSGARIKDYLIVLTCKEVRDELRKSNSLSWRL